MGTQRIDKQKDLLLERWYHFFLDANKTAARLGHGIACNPKQKSELMDMQERVAEDDMWPKGVPLPPLVVHVKVPAGQYMFIDTNTMKVLTAQAAVKSNKGLGRFKELYTPSRGLKSIN